MKYRDEEGKLQEICLPSSGDTLPIGSITAYSANEVPTGWLLCDGQAVSRVDYKELFNVIGTVYGEGNGSTTFNVPDFSGRVPIGLDVNDTDFNSIGKTYGEKEHQLTVEELPSHNHNLIMSSSATGVGGYGRPPLANNLNTLVENENPVKATGGNQPHNNVQPSIVQNYIIKAKNSVGLVGNVTGVHSSSKQDTYNCDYINNISGKILWTNPNPNDVFTETEITLNSTNYNYIKWIYKLDKSLDLTNSAESMKHNGTQLMYSSGALFKFFNRYIRYVSDNKYKIENGKAYEPSKIETNNNFCVPLYAIGYNLDIFESEDEGA